MTRLPITTLGDADADAKHASELIEQKLNELLSDRERVVFAVSGGRSPWKMFKQLASSTAVDWNAVHIVQVDERIAPDGDPDRNWTMLHEVFSESLPEANLHPMPVASTFPEQDAVHYEYLLQNLTGGYSIGLTHLGLGADGHTASLFPGDDALTVQNRTVVTTDKVYAGRRRMTLTAAAINTSDHILWQIQGSDKSVMLQRLIDGDQSIPAGLIRRTDVHIVADAAAAGVS